MTLLALNTFRKKIAYSPFHFFGLAHPKYAPLTSQCNTLVAEYAWQAFDQASRSDIRAAIADAERALRDALGYSVGPEYVVSEEHAWTGGPIVLNYGKVRALGQRQETLIFDNAPVVFADIDNDGLLETFRITASTTATDATSIIVKSGDREIRPITATIAAGTVTVEGPIWLIVKPELYERPVVVGHDPTDSNTFLGTLSIYQVMTDSTATATFYYRNNALVTQPTLSWYVRDFEKGIIAPYRMCQSTWLDCGLYPTHVRINYLAGDTFSEWETVVTRFALAEMSRRLCDDGNRELARWQRDMTSNNGDAALFQMKYDDASNPFGTRAGHMQAWLKVAARRRQIGIAV